MLSNAMILLQLSDCCGPIGPFTRGGQSGGLCRGLWCRGIRSCCPEAHNDEPRWQVPNLAHEKNIKVLKCPVPKNRTKDDKSTTVTSCSAFHNLETPTAKLIAGGGTLESPLWTSKKKSTRVDPCRWIPSHVAQLARRLTKVDIPIQKYQKVIP